MRLGGRVGDDRQVFDGFEEWDVDVGGGVVLHGRHGGAGPPVVLLHGHPRTHTTWHHVAPLLVAGGYTVVCLDLRGYGRSSTPPTRPDHAQQSKREMAADIVALMRRLGHDRFAVVGHDRGGYVALRLALDVPEAVSSLAVLDCVPIGEALARADARFAQAWWHWFFFAQPDTPERAIRTDPDDFYGGDPQRMGAGNYDDYRRAIHDPDTVHAMLEDYRAGLGVDRDADDADRAAGHRVQCPTLVAWSAHDDLEDLYGDVLAIWRGWAHDLVGAVIDSGHHMAEQAPGQLAATVIRFLAGETVRTVAGVFLERSSADNPRAFYAAYLQRCNEHRFNELGDFVADDVAVNGAPVGLGGYSAGLRAVVDAFDDYRWELRHLLVEGSLLSVHLHDTGTHTGTRWGIPPTGRHIVTHEFAVYQMSGGKIAEVWVTADDVAVMHQLRTPDR